ncbi:MAG: transcriptional regulator [Thermoplasmataceae archaeon]
MKTLSDKANILFKEIDENLDTVRRHLSIVQTLLKDQPAGIIKISKLTGLADHKIRYSLKILEKDGIVIASKEGAMLSPEFIQDKDSIVDQSSKILKKCSALNKQIRKTFIGKK